MNIIQKYANYTACAGPVKITIHEFRPTLGPEADNPPRKVYTELCIQPDPVCVYVCIHPPRLGLSSAVGSFHPTQTDGHEANVNYE